MICRIRCLTIIWTSAGSEFLIEIHTFPFKKMHLKISSAKWRLFRRCPNVLAMMLRCNNVLYMVAGRGSRADSRFVPSLAGCKPRMSPVVAVWWVSGSRVKTRGQCYSLDHDWPSYIRLACLLDCDWPSSSRLACPQLLNTGELRQIEDSGRVPVSIPPQVLDICPTGLVMGPNWVIPYKVVLSRWSQLTSFSLWAGVRFWDIFFFGENS